MTLVPKSSGEVLAISGSLRRTSINSAVLRGAALSAAREGFRVRVDDSIRTLPHFDPDLEADPPEAVLRFRDACETASGVLLAVPEYAFGIPGAFKNALDWTVGSGSLYRKPVTALGTAHPSRGGHVREALDLVLTAMGADAVHHALPVGPEDLDRHGELVTRRVLDELAFVVAGLAGRASSATAA